MNKFFGPLAAVFIGVVLIFAIRILFFDHPQPSSLRPEHLVAIGEIQSTDGDVESRSSTSVGDADVVAPEPLYAQETIVTKRASTALLSFKNGATVRLLDSSRAVVSAQDSVDQGVLITILDGDVEVLNQGPNGKLKLMQNGQPRSLSQTAVVPAIRLGGNPAAGQDLPDRGSGIMIAVSTPVPGGTPVNPAAAAAPNSTELGANVDPHAISDLEIKKQMRAQTGFFQRCYVNFAAKQSAEHKPVSGGTLTVAFKINPNGKISDSKMIRSDLTDAALSSCILDVVSRTSFRSFSGDAIDVGEFPITLY